MANKLPSNFLTAEVLLNGAPINASYNLVSIGIIRAVSSIGSAELVFALNPSDDTLDAGESYDFAPGRMLEVKAGNDGVNTSLFKGIIVQQGIRMAGTAAPEFIVQCSEEAIKMTNGRKNRYFQQKQDSAVISDIVKEYDLSSAVDFTEYTHPQLIQYQSSDWDFILARAAANGLLVYTDGAKVMVRKPGDSETPGMTLDYGTNVYSFDCALDVRAQIASIGTGATLSGVRLSALRGTLKTMGSAAPRLNVPVHLKGFGNRFDGDALVTSIRHEISDGEWYTTLGFGLPAEKDTDKVLTIQTPDGNAFILSDRDKSIRLKGQNGHSLLMDSSGITLESMQDLVIKAKGKIEMKAGGGISATAVGDIQLEGLNVKASAEVALVVQGNATAELKASGQTTVKGSIVMIN